MLPGFETCPHCGEVIGWEITPEGNFPVYFCECEVARELMRELEV